MSIGAGAAGGAGGRLIAPRTTASTIEFEPDFGASPDPEPKRSDGRVRRRRAALASRWVTRRRRLLIPAVAGVVGILAFLSLRGPSQHVPTQAEIKATASSVAAEATAEARAQPARSTQVYATIVASLVLIRTGSTTPDDDGLGSGVIINANGSILTAFHVIDGAAAIELTFADGTQANATVVSSDPTNDTAVLLPDALPEVVVPAVLGGGVRVGDEVFAVGNPLGLVGSLSAGVVSGLNRSIPVSSGTELSGLIQFDAAVNPGNSGGPLLNRNGQVVGIVTALANPSEQGFFIGIGFAVPIATAGGAAGSPAQ
jgi:S1-C subfamily serine protease